MFDGNANADGDADANATADAMVTAIALLAHHTGKFKIILTSTILWVNSADGKVSTFFLIFSWKICFEISC